MSVASAFPLTKLLWVHDAPFKVRYVYQKSDGSSWIVVKFDPWDDSGISLQGAFGDEWPLDSDEGRAWQGT